MSFAKCNREGQPAATMWQYRLKILLRNHVFLLSIFTAFFVLIALKATSGAVWAGISGSSNACAQVKERRYEDASTGFSILIPDGFIQETLPEAVTGAAFRPGTETYPRYNLLVFPEVRAVSRRSQKKLVQEIKDSYAKIGFHNTEVVRSEIASPEALGSTLITTLLYSSQSQRRRAHVALFSSADRHYYLTLVTSLETDNLSGELFQNLLDSVQLAGGPGPAIEPDQSGSSFYLVLVVALLLLLSGRLIMLKRRTRLRNNAT